MIVSIQNQKGGVGKTATAVSLAAIAQTTGYETLLVDLDPQGSASEQLVPAHQGYGTGDVLAGRVSLGDALVAARGADDPTKPGLSLLPGDEGLIAAEFALRGDDALLAVRHLLEPVRRVFAMIFIDVGPSISMLSAASLLAADLVLCPFTLQSPSLRGITRLLEMTRTVAAQHHHAPSVLFLPVAADGRLRETRELLDVLQDAYGTYPDGTVLHPVRYASALSRAYGERLTILEYASRHPEITGKPNRSAMRAVHDYARVFDCLATINQQQPAPVNA